MVRVRFAPSPTGLLHIGGVRTALYNFLFAKKNKGVFLLRIEDTDQKRYVNFAEDYIKDSLKWCNIEYDEGVGKEGDKGPYRQSERKEIYKKHVQVLLEKGHAYYAFDTKKDLEQMRENLQKAGVASPKYDGIIREKMKNSLTLSEEEVKKLLKNNAEYVVRIKMPRNQEVKLHDIIRGWVVVNSNTLDDKVIFKSDGMPTYHLANVVDDYLMGITHVIRGEEWLPSAPLHIMLYEFLGWSSSVPKFAHLPLILRPDGKGKLSKRDGEKNGFPVFPLSQRNNNSNISGFREEGFLPSAFVNMLAFLGWNPGSEREIFSLEELINEFSLERVSKSGAKFDYEKTKWFNQQHIKSLSNHDIFLILKDKFSEYNQGECLSDNLIKKIIGLEKERAVFLNEIVKNSHFYFNSPKIFCQDYYTEKHTKEQELILIEKTIKLGELIDSISSFDCETIEKDIKFFIKEKKLSFGTVLPLLRFIITGERKGPSIYSIMEIIGKKGINSRILNFVKKSNRLK